MSAKKAFTESQIKWWLANNKARVGKFKGVKQDGDEFYYTDPKGIKRQIILLEQQEDFLIKKYLDKSYGLTSLQKFYGKIASDYTGISREKVAETLNKIPVYQQFKPAMHT